MKSKSRRGEDVRSPRLFGNGSHFSWGRKKNWVLLAEFFLSKRKKNLAGTLSGKVLAEKMGFEPMPHSSHATPLAGEPLGPLGYFSIPYGERGIRTPGAFRHHWFSRPAPSTARPSLHVVEPAKDIITAFARRVNPLFSKKYGFSEILSLNGGKRKQEPHEMRPCLKRQPSKAQGFSAAAVL